MRQKGLSSQVVPHVMRWAGSSPKGSWICPKCEFACYKALINNRLVTGMFKHCTFRCKSNATINIQWKFVPSFCIYNIFIDINLIFRYDVKAMRRW